MEKYYYFGSMNLYYILLLSMVLSLLASLSLYFQRKDDAWLRYFPPFLLLSVLVEGANSYGLISADNNHAVYNFFSLIEFTFYFFILREVIRGRRMKRIIQVVIFVYAALHLGNIIFIQKINGFPGMTYALGCLVIVAICIYYFYELFQIPQPVALVRQPAFWICSGLLFFYCVSFPIFAPMNLLKGLPPVILKNLVQIIQVLNVLLYSSFTIAFLCRPRTRKSMSLS
jgi:hypothetical protein